ncbi:PaaX family transcriptional regulator C-terminal domain-containing protein [Nonomuraea indica]|uniref:PaaX family transcriptional regulator C-terminal domain-containing protein n=1 Tax=Nonomuraea indica TaxID=1581193 RepID=UPI000C7A7E33|nr:PaaX family transcriptional regulator C-terminal domain-containing protein [Nonomuraea indica]
MPTKGTPPAAAADVTPRTGVASAGASHVGASHADASHADVAGHPAAGVAGAAGAPAGPAGEVVAGLRPLSARSVVLSLLLGSHPPELPVHALVRIVEPFGISGATLRVALTRMVAAGDLRRTGSTYRLSDRLLLRQRRQDAAIDPAVGPAVGSSVRAWDGDWELAVVTATGRGAAERAQLRADLAALRLAELREGLWTRPANLTRSWPGHLAPLVQRWTGRPGAPDAELARALWDLEGWAGTGHALLSAYGEATAPADRFAIVAAIVRHLLTDPVLPEPLLPPGWPAPALRATHAAYRQELTTLARAAV